MSASLRFPVAAMASVDEYASPHGIVISKESGNLRVERPAVDSYAELQLHQGKQILHGAIAET